MQRHADTRRSALPKAPGADDGDNKGVVVGGAEELWADSPAHVVTAAVGDESKSRTLLPRRQLEPTPSRPFIFFHLEKCGGTTMRQ